MSARDRILAVLHHETPDVIPFTTYVESHQLAGLALYAPWRKLLDKGLGIHAAFAVQTHTTNCPHAAMDITHHYKSRTSWSPVDILSAIDSPHEITGQIATPKGSLAFRAQAEGADLSRMIPWFPEGGHIIGGPEDYEVATALVEDTEYIPHYKDIEEFQTILGDYGIVPAFVPKSPLQAMIMAMGPRNLSLGAYLHQAEFDELYRVIYKKDLEAYQIAAESPTEVIWGPDNITSLVTSPKFFEKYSLDFYNEAAKIFHKYDKVYVVHMDGELKALAPLIAQTDIDAVESFTPPPVGDLLISEARAQWGNKIIWANFPEPVSLEGQVAVRKKTQEMLKDAAPLENFLMGVSEGFPSNLHMFDSVPTILRTVNKYGKL